jgi:hypothetical protein
MQRAVKPGNHTEDGDKIIFDYDFGDATQDDMVGGSAAPTPPPTPAPTPHIISTPAPIRWVDLIPLTHFPGSLSLGGRVIRGRHQLSLLAT